VKAALEFFTTQGPMYFFTHNGAPCLKKRMHL
jgi:hypothetical protein